MYTWRVDFFYQEWKKGEDDDAVMENIDEEDPPQSVDLQEKIVTRIRKGCLENNILKKLGMAQCVIRDRDFLFFIRLFCHCMTHNFPESCSTNIFHIIMR